MQQMAGSERLVMDAAMCWVSGLPGAVREHGIRCDRCDGSLDVAPLGDIGCRPVPTESLDCNESIW
jgi:uncharacterized membrane protein